jgi:hypothetical protein
MSEEEIGIEAISKTLPMEIVQEITQELIDELKFEDIAMVKETKSNIDKIKELTDQNSTEVTKEIIKNYDCMRGIAK